MTGGVVNLRTACKQRARARKRAAGDASAAKHGRSKAERRVEEQRAQAEKRHLDGHKREP